MVNGVILRTPRCSFALLPFSKIGELVAENIDQSSPVNLALGHCNHTARRHQLDAVIHQRYHKEKAEQGADGDECKCANGHVGCHMDQR